MNRTISACALFCAVASWLTVSFAAPSVLGDDNTFLKNFVENELLNFLGVVVTITLASAANLHLELNKIEEARGQRNMFVKTRQSMRLSAYFLIWMMAVAVGLLVIKPLVAVNQTIQSLFNGAGLLIVLANVLILADLTSAAFKLEPRIHEPRGQG